MTAGRGRSYVVMRSGELAALNVEPVDLHDPKARFRVVSVAAGEDASASERPQPGRRRRAKRAALDFVEKVLTVAPPTMR